MPNLPLPALIAAAAVLGVGNAAFMFLGRDVALKRRLFPAILVVATALFVPVAVLAIWWIVRRIRRRHIAAKE